MKTIIVHKNEKLNYGNNLAKNLYVFKYSRAKLLKLKQSIDYPICTVTLN